MTTGGSTSGRCTSPSSSAFPGKRPRARTKATSTASGSAAATAVSEILRLSASACHSASLSTA